MKKGEYANHAKYGTVRIISQIQSMSGATAYVVVTYDNRKVIVGKSELVPSRTMNIQIKEDK